MAGLLGSHSICKFAAEHVRNVGYPKVTRIYKIVGKARGMYPMSI
jgi:hypothetical protein